MREAGKGTMRTQEIKVVIDEKSAQIAYDLIELHRQARAILDTIFRAELLVNLPPGKDDREKHNAAIVMLEMLHERIGAVPADQATVPSVFAFEAAKEAAAAS